MKEFNEWKLFASIRNSKWKSALHKKVRPIWIEFWLAKIRQIISQHVTLKMSLRHAWAYKMRLYHEISESLIIQREGSHSIQKYLTKSWQFGGEGILYILKLKAYKREQKCSWSHIIKNAKFLDHIWQSLAHTRYEQL